MTVTAIATSVEIAEATAKTTAKAAAKATEYYIFIAVLTSINNK